MRFSITIGSHNYGSQETLPSPAHKLENQDSWRGPKEDEYHSSKDKLNALPCNQPGWNEHSLQRHLCLFIWLFDYWHNTPAVRIFFPESHDGIRKRRHPEGTFYPPERFYTVLATCRSPLQNEIEAWIRTGYGRGTTPSPELLDVYRYPRSSIFILAFQGPKTNSGEPLDFFVPLSKVVTVNKSPFSAFHYFDSPNWSQ